MILKGYAAHFKRANKNRERVTTDAFDDIIKEFNKGNVLIPINVDHNDNNIVGKVIKMYKDEVGLIIEAEIFDNMVNGEYYKTLIENGLFTRFSTQGYVRAENEKELNDGTVLIDKFRLTAVAIVNQPADVNAVLYAAGEKNEGKLMKMNTEYEEEVQNKISVFSLI